MQAIKLAKSSGKPRARSEEREGIIDTDVYFIEQLRCD